LHSPLESAYIGAEETAEEAFINVCHGSGATLPERDTVDKRVIHEVQTGTGKVPLTISDIPGEAFPVLNSLPAPDDTDHDGMPDEWEDISGLDPNNASDRNNISPDGYTMLEEYLNSIEFTRKVEGITITSSIENKPEISWAETFLGEDGYIIERAESEGEFAVLDSVGSNISFYLDITASEGTVYRYRVKAFNRYTESLYSSVVTSNPVSAEDSQMVPGFLNIYPNPIRNVVHVEFYLDEGTEVDISIVDMNGRVIRNITNKLYGPGSHTVSWSNDPGSVIKPGIYICTLTTSDSFKALKFTVSK
jgi:hypothetical protein